MRAALTLVGIAAACGPSLPGHLARVVATSPSGTIAPDQVAVEIAFSAPVDPAGLADGRRLALCRREDLRDVLRAIESDTGVGAGVPVVPARVEVADEGRRVVLRPDAPLDPDRPWAALLSNRARSADGRPILDGEGKPRTVAILFDTGPAVDRVAPRPRWVLPPHGPVPSNVRTMLVGFDEPVTGTLAVTPRDTRSRPLTSELLELEPAGPLPPGALVIDLDGIRDAAGNEASALEPLTVSRCASDAAPPLESEVRVRSGRLDLQLEGALRGMGRLVAELSARPGAPACGVVPAPPDVLVAMGDISPCPGWDPCAPEAVSCPAALEVTGLCPGQELILRVATEDLAGHRGAFVARGTAAAQAPLAEPVVTEVLADADAPEEGGEYVEVANVGTGDLDLTGYSLAKRTSSGKLVRCTIAAGTEPVAPGRHALVVGGAYDRRYGLPEGTALARCGTTALDGGLSNELPVAIALIDHGGATVSSAGFTAPVERCATGALERIHPGLPDTPSNWTCPGTRSPGACNAATPVGECPRRPW